ncbi:MAG: efflux transporter outer membrane subunit [Pseudomonadota bacterium]
MTFRASMLAALYAPALLLTACATSPDYVAPRPNVGGAWLNPVDQGEVDAVWWRSFSDPVLAAIVDAALAENKSLDEADARLREARAQRDAVHGRATPQANLGALATENRLSLNGQLPVGRVPGLGRDLSLYDVGFDAAWELDLWGGVRRGKESADARLDAAAEARRSAILQVIAEAARAYFDLRTAQALKANAIADARAQADLADLVARRERAGAASRFDVVRAQAQARSTAAAVAAHDAEAATAAYRLALLTGRPPEALDPSWIAAAPLPAPPAGVTAGLRSDLLLRRPDVRRAERDLAASTADIGVATADLFPRVSLLGFTGLQAQEIGDLGSPDSLRFQFGPSLRWPIFSGGQIRARIRAADARADAAAARYEDAVLTALSESETAINRYRASSRVRLERDRARQDADEAVTLARRRFEAGEEDLTAVLQAQFTASALDRLAILAQADQLRQTAALYKALGGGWEAAEAYRPPSPSSATR